MFTLLYKPLVSSLRSKRHFSSGSDSEGGLASWLEKNSNTYYISLFVELMELPNRHKKVLFDSVETRCLTGLLGYG